MTTIANKTRLYESLGQIVVSFKTLEQWMDGLILSSFDSPAAQTFILINSMSFRQKVLTMNDLIRSLHTEQELGALNQTLDALVERCLSCEQQRDNWVRSYWVPEMESQPGVVIRLQNSGDSSGLTLRPVNVSELENFVVVLNATVAYLCGFHQKLSNNFNRIHSIQAVESFLKAPMLTEDK